MPAVHRSGATVQCTPVANYPLGVQVEITPTQEGTGDPSPENVRPIVGWDAVNIHQSNGDQDKTYTVQLGQTVYGGTLDAVTGEGAKTIHRAVLDGTEEWVLNAQMKDSGINGFQTALEFLADDSYDCICSHFGGMKWDGILKEDSVAVTSKVMVVRTNGSETLEDWESFLAAQAAAGTPVTIAYKLATPTPIQATGNQTIPALPGTNTLYADTGNITVTGASDPIATITALQNRVSALESAQTNL